MGKDYGDYGDYGDYEEGSKVNIGWILWAGMWRKFIQVYGNGNF